PLPGPALCISPRAPECAGRSGLAVALRFLPGSAGSTEAPPSDAGVAQVAARVAGRIARLLQRRGLEPEADPEETDSLIRNEPLLAALYGASVSGRTATGPRAGMRVTTADNQINAESPGVLAGPCCASVSGVNVNAGVCVAARE